MGTGSSSGAIAPVAGNLFRNDGGETVNNKVAFSVHRNGSNLTLGSSSTPTKIQFTAEEFDQDASYDSVTNFNFAPKPGKYALMGAVASTGAVVDQGNIVAIIYKNGAQWKSGNFAAVSGTGATTGSVVSCIAIADPGDVFDLRVAQVNGSASNITISGKETDTYFQGFQIG